VLGKSKRAEACPDPVCKETPGKRRTASIIPGGLGRSSPVKYDSRKVSEREVGAKGTVDARVVRSEAAQEQK